MKVIFTKLSNQIPLLAVLLSVILSGCDSSLVFEKNERIPSATWSSEQILEFPVEITDTLQPHNIYINIRNQNDYPLSNLFLFITITSPDGLHNRDTVQCFLAEPSGKWLGKGFGNVWSNRFSYKTNVRFPVGGIYNFHLEQAMRLEKLPGISDVGLRIEKIE